ncbi:hypothetical protein [Caproiciproducens sp.]
MNEYIELTYQNIIRTNAIGILKNFYNNVMTYKQNHPESKETLCFTMNLSAMPDFLIESTHYLLDHKLIQAHKDKDSEYTSITAHLTPKGYKLCKGEC